MNEPDPILQAATCLAMNLGKALTDLAKSQDRTAQAIERLADVYLEVNVPEEDRELRDGQSLSDVGP